MTITYALGIAADCLLVAIQAVFILCCWVYLISGLDDLVVDLLWFGFKVYDRLSGRRFPHPTRADLLAVPERPLAIMFPAWHEADVIAAAVSNIIETIEYHDFQVFIGTYPNDADTQREADLLVRRFPNVHKVVTSAPGPTCKADCLNHVIAAIRAFEASSGTEFAGVVMQDAEDVVPPLALHVFNYYAREFDLVQIPVLSLPRAWWDLTGGHYMEEFAEFGAKEMYVRERFAGVVPGCGVGTFYSKHALALAEETGEAFSTRSLTEDYEFSFRLRDAGLRMHFARIFMAAEAKNGTGAREGKRTLIATREYFPNQFRAAFRQKSRWTVGIALQGWRNFGWKASWRVRYLFWRDRRGLFLAHVTVLGVIAFLAFLSLEIYAHLIPGAGRPAPLLPEDSWLWNVVWLNMALLVHRLMQRHLWAYVHYGARVLPMVTLRYLWAVAVNYCALVRALRLWGRHLRTGKPIGWDKTAHTFPIGTVATSLPDLPVVKPGFEPGLGAFLLERHLLNPADLAYAEAQATANERRIEDVLLDAGFVDEHTLADAIADHAGLARCDCDPTEASSLRFAEMSLETARAFRCMPFGRTAHGSLVLATPYQPGLDQVGCLEQVLGQQVEMRITTRTALDHLLDGITAQAGQVVAHQTATQAQGSDQLAMTGDGGPADRVPERGRSTERRS